MILVSKFVKHPEVAGSAFSEMMVVADDKHRRLYVFHKIILDEIFRRYRRKLFCKFYNDKIINA